MSVNVYGIQTLNCHVMLRVRAETTAYGSSLGNEERARVSYNTMRERVSMIRVCLKFSPSFFYRRPLHVKGSAPRKSRGFQKVSHVTLLTRRGLLETTPLTRISAVCCSSLWKDSILRRRRERRNDEEKPENCPRSQKSSGISAYNFCGSYFLSSVFISASRPVSSHTGNVRAFIVTFLAHMYELSWRCCRDFSKSRTR